MKKEQTNTLTSSDQGRVARRRARVRADLLAAARQVFVNRGYQDATISEIIQVADVAMGTFYLHFRDKEAVLQALTEEVFQMLREKIHAALAEHSDQPLIPLIIRTLFHSACQQRDLFVLLCSGEAHLVAHTGTQRAQQGLVTHFIPLFEAAREQGELGTDDPVFLAHVLVGMLVRAITWTFDQEAPDPDRMTDQILSVLERGLPPSLLERTAGPLTEEQER
ncbi:hypothetical protein KSC_016930 [Ktedonobacter sp. SOSP1-52]|uniref:TetR/AcrR family transcriptional regulator n=1 Tax=Ktedonobacter sp. SOSP1-52 TaxID=2778366 RepID=UPI0019168D3C|nr:TetR/AcrR family transcriptional regulator [Ktedonobacter sp. SOSP1-52]GHO62801.1 hypothetical protein KSC_016930 [Ktedonobacter sp. SOSP1-52]